MNVYLYVLHMINRAYRKLVPKILDSTFTVFVVYYRAVSSGAGLHLLQNLIYAQVEVPSGSDLRPDQVQRTRCVPRPKLQGLGFGSSAQ